MKRGLELSGIILIIAISFFLWYQKDRYQKEDQRISEEQVIIQKIEKIKSHYHHTAKTVNKANLYIIEDQTTKVIGTVSQDIILQLQEMTEFTSDTLYFALSDLPYYISYEDVFPTKEEPVVDLEYQNYVVFNENIKTKNKTDFYQGDTLIYSIAEGMSLPIIIKNDTEYYVEYANQLLAIKKEEGEVIENHNTDQTVATSVPALTYHFFHTKDQTCLQSICLVQEKFDEQMKYLKDNQYYIVGMNALEMFIDGKIQLPEHTVLLTIDDGYGVDVAIGILEKYGFKASLFLITSSNKPEDYQTDVFEYHSHGHDIHNTGECPGGQGGAIKCKDREFLLNDLATSREIVNQSTVFCYPFYEYNNYAISILKEAGFTMAFAGQAGNIKRAQNKMALPRYTILSTTTLATFISYVS